MTESSPPVELILDATSATDGLTPEEVSVREILFAQAWCKSFNVNDAARQAGYRSERIGSIGAQLLNRPKVKRLVRAAVEAKLSRLQLEGDRIMQEQGYMAMSDIGDVIEFTDHGTVRLKKRIPKRARKAIASIKIKRSLERTGPDNKDWEEFETVEIKMHNKAAANGLLMKYAGLLTDKLEIEMKSPATLVVRRMTKAERDTQAAAHDTASKTTPDLETKIP